jgi:ferrochelatase
VKKVAVVLFNLGGPDSKDSIKPFLFNFFMDPNIIPLPKPLRWLIAKSISLRRSRNEAADSYGELGNKSPLLENSQAQAAALEKVLNARGVANFKTFVSMRYWHPMADEVAKDVRNWYADEIVLLPLYPQFSTTTTWSSLGVWNKVAAGITPRTATICCYPMNDGFIKASAENIKIQIQNAENNGHKNPRVLFSAHGLPESVIEGGDPYQWQCEETAKKIADELGLKDWLVCYQSRVGPKKWIGPSTEDEIRRAAAENKPIVIYPHAFTQEHVETLVELDIEYKEIAHELGLHGYYRADTVSTNPAFIDGLAQLVLARTHKEGVEDGEKAEGGKIICPEKFTRCCMRMAEA